MLGRLGGRPKRVALVIPDVSAKVSLLKFDQVPQRRAFVQRIADVIASSTALRLRGVMAVAPLDQDPRAAFERLRELHQQLLSEHPQAEVMSAGMSGDLESAVAAGTTHVRIGTAVLGHRAYVG